MATCRHWPCAWAGRRSWAGQVPAASHCGREAGSRGQAWRGAAPSPAHPRPTRSSSPQGLSSWAPDANPVGCLLAGHERFQVVAAQVVGRPLVDPLREPLQQAHRHVPVGGGGGNEVGLGLPTHCAWPTPPPRRPIPPAQEGEPLKEEAARLLHALRVRAPVLQAVMREVPQDVQALGRRDVPVPLLLDLREQPRLEQGATGGGRQVEVSGPLGKPRPPTPRSPASQLHSHTTLKARKFGTLLVVQWLRLHAPNAGDLGFIPCLGVGQ